MTIRSTVSIEDVKSRIFAQDVPRNIQRSGLFLFNHLRGSIDLDTGKRYTKAKALSSVLSWMFECKSKQERIRRMLAPQQRELVQMLVDGMTQDQIAIQLEINSRNVRRRFARVRNRLGVETLYQVVALSVGYGWVDIENLDK